MPYCREHSAVKETDETKQAVSLPCRAWTCPDCAPQRKSALIASGHAGQPTKFLTLTYRRTDRTTPDRAALELTRAWRLVRLRLMRLYKLKKLPFLAVMEKTQAGWPHLHILLRSKFLSVKKISEYMDEIADSPFVWIEDISGSRKVRSYVAKYCGKAAQKFATAKRYYSSRDWDLTKNPHKQENAATPGAWVLWHEQLPFLSDLWLSKGLIVDWLSWDRIAARQPGSDPPKIGRPASRPPSRVKTGFQPA